MSRLENALKELHEAVKESSYSNTTWFSVHINCQGYVTKSGNTTPEALENDDISMRNIRGEWIK